MRNELPHHVDNVVIGGGQAGLAIGYFLAKQKQDFIIFDASERIGDAWRNRWASLRLFTQAQYSSLPGMAFPVPDDSYPTKDEMAAYLEAYAERFDLPVCLDTTVDGLAWNSDCYVFDIDSERVLADQVVVATGPFHHPHVPAFADELDSTITQIHSRDYQSPNQLPDGDILVVGAGNSGAEIAVELASTDRHIWLSGQIPGHIPLPLNWVNNRLFWWLFGSILTVDTRIGRTLIERAKGGGDPLIRLTPADIRRAGVERVPRTASVTDGMPRLDDGRVLAVDGVVWATGFRPDYSWIEVPGLRLGEDGYPVHDRGIVNGEPGLYFLGLPYQSTLVSDTIGRVGADARYLAEHIRTQTDADEAAQQPQVIETQ